MALRIRRRERRGLRLWPVGFVLVLAFATAIIVAASAFYTGWDLLGAHGLKQERRLDSKTLFDLVKLSFGVVAGAGALVALIVAYRRQRIDEDGALREATRLHTERFTTAVGQLGDDSPAVRLGGVHALAGLADDAPTRGLRQTCIDVLCAYVRLPYAFVPDASGGNERNSSEVESARREYLAFREIRHTIIRLIRDHLRLAEDHPHSWQGHDFDFTDAVFDGGDFSKANFSGGTVTFVGSQFLHGVVSFSEARFSGARVDFIAANFSGVMTSFLHADFSGGAVTFMGSTFPGATMNFSLARFAGGRVDFALVELSADTTLSFNSAKFAGGVVDFKNTSVSVGRFFFQGAEGPPPRHLLPEDGSDLPVGLDVPDRWLP
ncbi:pentapeptide repeat-containing protein [Streptomyces sp. BH105]|uniref:pentapeptide repeat-containing protein n=1 Tax=Streptomyces sp. BH105 TaxID=3410408 RepID=UPI003CEA1AA6